MGKKTKKLHEEKERHFDKKIAIIGVIVGFFSIIFGFWKIFKPISAGVPAENVSQAIVIKQTCNGKNCRQIGVVENDVVIESGSKEGPKEQKR